MSATLSVSESANLIISTTNVQKSQNQYYTQHEYKFILMLIVTSAICCPKVSYVSEPLECLALGLDKKVVFERHDHPQGDTTATVRRHPAPVPVYFVSLHLSDPCLRDQIRWSCLHPCGLQVGLRTYMPCPKYCHAYQPLHADV
uniref:Uncharacterized protein n=1 Tax=Hyaloperonospora arabidopsidis (strain Emoy2) TaxID=559515 RepID=M4BV76_HYAAE